MKVEGRREGRGLSRRLGFTVAAAALLWLCTFLGAFPAGAAEVRNVEIKKAGHRLLFTYDLEGEEREELVSVFVTVGDRTYPAKQLHLEGDLGRVRPGKNRRIAWNVLVDFPQGVYQPVSVEIYSGLPRIVNSIGMTLVLVPAGTATTGSPTDEQGRLTDEMRQRTRLHRPFYLQTTEVTQGQWRRVMGNESAHFRSCGDACPADQVSWTDAQEFIRRLNALEGTENYRLPTETEWEYAARAGTTTAYYWGRSPDCSRANYGNSLWASDCLGVNPGKTKPVCSYRPNAWGLYDMTGNVWEWVESDEAAREGLFHIQRGGAWDSDANACRVAFRAKGLPEARRGHMKLAPGNIGFRVARTVE
ncbi:MAG: formylglycine-generating enzyme family protein [Pseudomonadota bacterium]|nr:formylglycine-generating enzyme family protein [Pseudomonadota bacterium]